MSRRIRSETRWVIVEKARSRGRDDGLLYTGQWLSREAAICEHVNAKGLPSGSVIHPHLTPEYRTPCGRDALLKGWRYWRKQGDRAVKATITWEEPAR